MRERYRGGGLGAEVLMDELTKAFPNVWCPNCNKVQPMKIAVMKANDRNDHDAADICAANASLW
jgi:hypothetical protein